MKDIKSLKSKTMRFLDAWSRAQTGLHGAAVAYCTVFSLAPLLVIATSIAGLFFDAGEVQKGLLMQFESVFGADGATLISSLVAANEPASVDIFKAIFGFVFLILGAMGIFSALQSALDRIFESFPEKEKEGMWQAVRKNLASLGIVLSLGFVIIVSLIASALLATLGGMLGRFLPGVQLMAVVSEFIMSFIIISSFMALMLKYLPSKRIPWRPAVAGGMIAGLLFMAGKYLLGLYFGLSNVGDAYGAASSLVLLILWTCYMSQAFFLSAIVAKLYFTAGGHKSPSSP